MRSGVFLPAPMAVGEVTHHPAAGLYGSLGALLAVLAERSGTTGQRVARIAAAGSAGVVSMLVGPHTAGVGIIPLVMVVAFSTVSAMLSSLSPVLSFAGMQLLVQMSIAGGLPRREPDGVVVAWYVGGIAWVVLGVLMQGRIERTPGLHRATLAGIVRDLATAVGDDAATLPVTLDLRLTELHRATTTAVSPRGRREVLEVLRLTDRITELMPVLEAVVATGEPAQRKLVSARLTRLGDDIASGRLPPESVGVPGSPASGYPAQQAITGIDSLGTDGIDAPGAAAPSLRTRIRAMAAGSSLRTGRWSYTTRLVSCMAVAEIVRQVLPLPRGYWILLTVALILKPDFQSVLARTLQRAGGTVVGAILAEVVLLGHSVPLNLTVMGLLAAPIPWAVRRNYAYFSVLITPIVLLILGFLGPVGPTGVLDRVALTATGCAVVVVFGWLAWRGTWLPPGRHHMAVVVGDLARYLDGASGRVRYRYALIGSLADLRAVAAHGALEPPPIRDRRERWAAVVDDATRVMQAGDLAISGDDRAALSAASRQLALLALMLRRARGGYGAAPGVQTDARGPLADEVARLCERVARIWLAGPVSPPETAT